MAKHEIALAVQLHARRVGMPAERRIVLTMNAERHLRNAGGLHATSVCVCLVGLAILACSRVRHEQARRSISVVLFILWLLLEFLMV